MKYKLSGKETAGVIVVGLAASEVAKRIANHQKSPKAHQTAMLIGGAALYFAGVYIGTNRPPAGYLAGSSNKKGSCHKCGSANHSTSHCHY